MDDGVEVFRTENGVQAVAVGDVAADDRNLAVGDAAHGIDGARGGVREVVEDDRVVACGEQFDDGVAADVAGTAGHQHLHPEGRDDGTS